jgi:uncharacterized membrane protein
MGFVEDVKKSSVNILRMCLIASALLSGLAAGATLFVSTDFFVFMILGVLLTAAMCFVLNGALKLQAEDEWKVAQDAQAKADVEAKAREEAAQVASIKDSEELP